MVGRLAPIRTKLLELGSFGRKALRTAGDQISQLISRKSRGRKVRRTGIGAITKLRVAC
jgi:hypothetical protein